MDLMTAKEAGNLWGITPRRVQALCEQGRVTGAEHLGNAWVIPKGTSKPVDARTKGARQYRTIRKPNVEKVSMATVAQPLNYSVVSYFCGCGGLDLGFRGNFKYRFEDYERLPFDIRAAYDKEEKCIETYNGYFHGKHAMCMDLSEVDLETVPKATVLIGGFPCQEFSSCGPLGGLETERGNLYKTLIAYMNKHEPTIVVGENVINLERMENGAVLNKIKTDLKSAGYEVNVWRLFAPDYGIPQRRTRLFIICVKNDIQKKYGFPKMPLPDFVDKHRSIEWAIGDLINVTDNSVPNQDQYFDASCAKRGNGQGDEKNKKDFPAYTIRANPKSRVQFHYTLNRRLTVRECARIQTFPDDFMFTHAKTTSVSQIGNAVPPVLAYTVAKSIANFLDEIKEVN